MPAGVSCTFFPNTLTIGPEGSPATSTLTIATTAPVVAWMRLSRGDLSRRWLHRMGLALAPMLFGAILVFVPKRRYLLNFCLSVLVIGGSISQVACGGGSSSASTANPGGSTPVGSYTIAVTGAAGKTQHTTSVTLVVQ
jgi:hypothetical protein